MHKRTHSHTHTTVAEAGLGLPLLRAARWSVGVFSPQRDIHHFSPGRASALTHRYKPGVAALSVDESTAISVLTGLIHLERI